MLRCLEDGLWWLCLALLAPWLKVQGKQVRRKTVQLPAPSGATAGQLQFLSQRLEDDEGRPCVRKQAQEQLSQRQTKGPPHISRLLVVGDSSALGVGVSDQRHSLLGCLSTHWPSTPTPQRMLLAQTGWRAVDLAQALECTPHFTGSASSQVGVDVAFEARSVALLIVGVNDVTARTGLSDWAHQLDLLRARCEQAGFDSIILCSPPPMHRFLALPQPLRWVMGWRSSLLSRAGKDWATRCGVHWYELPRMRDIASSLDSHLSLAEQAQVKAQSHHPDSQWLAADGFHPSALAYLVWAKSLATYIRCRLC